MSVLYSIAWCNTVCSTNAGPVRQSTDAGIPDATVTWSTVDCRPHEALCTEHTREQLQSLELGDWRRRGVASFAIPLGSQCPDIRYTMSFGGSAFGLILVKFKYLCQIAFGAIYRSVMPPSLSTGHIAACVLPRGCA